MTMLAQYVHSVKVGYHKTRCREEVRLLSAKETKHTIANPLASLDPKAKFYLSLAISTQPKKGRGML